MLILKATAKVWVIQEDSGGRLDLADRVSEDQVSAEGLARASVKHLLVQVPVPKEEGTEAIQGVIQEAMEDIKEDMAATLTAAEDIIHITAGDSEDTHILMEEVSDMDTQDSWDWDLEGFMEESHTTMLLMDTVEVGSSPVLRVKKTQRPVKAVVV
jgi:hypothetical protein